MERRDDGWSLGPDPDQARDEAETAGVPPAAELALADDPGVPEAPAVGRLAVASHHEPRRAAAAGLLADPEADADARIGHNASDRVAWCHGRSPETGNTQTWVRGVRRRRGSACPRTWNRRWTRGNCAPDQQADGPKMNTSDRAH